MLSSRLIIFKVCTIRWDFSYARFIDLPLFHWASNCSVIPKVFRLTSFFNPAIFIEPDKLWLLWDARAEFLSANIKSSLNVEVFRTSRHMEKANLTSFWRDSVRRSNFIKQNFSPRVCWLGRRENRYLSWWRNEAKKVKQLEAYISAPTAREVMAALSESKILCVM